MVLKEGFLRVKVNRYLSQLRPHSRYQGIGVFERKREVRLTLPVLGDRRPISPGVSRPTAARDLPAGSFVFSAYRVSLR